MKVKISQLLFLGILIPFLSCSANKNVSNDSEKNLKKIPKTIDLQQVGKSGIFILDKQICTPDSNGIIADIALKLPEYNKGMFYRPFSNRVASGNRMEPLWFSDISDFQNYKHQKPREDNSLVFGSFIILQKKNGNFLAILPIVSNQVGNTLEIGKTTFNLRMATYGTAKVETTIPLLAYAESTSPYEATRMVWALAKDTEGVKGNVNWRSDKAFPEPFKYLGWCSWEHYKREISEEILTNAIKDIKSSDLPIRWILVDDGYLDQENNKLISFGIDKKKFPNGWKPITSLKDDKIKWMGIWRNFGGYMSGISPKNTMANLAEHIDLEPKKNKVLMSKNNEASANAFYEAMTADTKNNGFDIIKVDFQSNNLMYNTGKENPVLGVHFANRALEEKVKEKDLKLINCIAMQNFNVFNQTHSNIIRSSVDYKTVLDRIDLTIVQNFTNAFWLGHVHWTDQDMFHTSFKGTARLMAVSRAISGGPIYLSDETKNIDNTYLKPLMYKDGKIIGTLAPGVPLPESLLQDPYIGKKPFKVIAPLKNNAAILMAVNLNRDNNVVKTSISLNDYTHAGGLIQPYQGAWSIPKGGILLYDSYNQKAEILNKDVEFDLKTREERLFQLSPIVDGWSVIGNSDKYLSAGAVDIKSISQSQVVCVLKETSSFMIWSEKGVPTLDGKSFKALGNGLFVMDVPFVSGEKEIIIKR